MTDKPFKEPKVGGKLDAAVPWMMAVGTLLAVAGFVLTFTLAPLATTWSRPPKPMSYAQPSPPNIQNVFLAS